MRRTRRNAPTNVPAALLHLNLSRDDKMAVNNEILNSWKEIALYLGRGVRTVQRWELELGLPVRRPRGKPRSAVVALKAELDSWLTGSQKETLSKEIITKPSIALPQAQSLRSSETELLVSRTKQVLERSVHVCKQSRHLYEQLARLTTRLAVKKPLQPPVTIQNTKASTTSS